MAERWQEIAHELGSWDIEDTESPPWRDMVNQKGRSYVGDYVKTEPACKRIAALEAERDRLQEEVLDLKNDAGLFDPPSNTHCHRCSEMWEECKCCGDCSEYPCACEDKDGLLASEWLLRTAKAEVERLTKLTEEAYHEGYLNAWDYLVNAVEPGEPWERGVGWRESWAESDARKALEGDA